MRRTTLFLALTLALGGCADQDRNASIEAANKGIDLAGQGQFAGAVKELQNATAVYKENHEAWYNLGQVFMQQKKWKDAADAFSEAVRYKDDDAMYHYRLGQSLYEALVEQQGGSLELAQTHLEKAVRLNPRLFKAHWYLGRVYYQQGKAQLAAQEWTEAAKLEPHFGRPFVDLGKLYLQWDYVPQAIAVLEQGTLGHATDASELTDIYYYLGLAYDTQKNWDKAIEAYTSAIEKRKDNLDAKLQRAFSYAQKGDKTKARVDLEEYLAQRKGNNDLGVQTANDLLLRVLAN